MEQPEQSLEILHMLRRCGHYLHHHWGCGRASQFCALRMLEDGGEMTQRHLRSFLAKLLDSWQAQLGKEAPQ